MKNQTTGSLVIASLLALAGNLPAGPSVAQAQEVAPLPAPSSASDFQSASPAEGTRPLLSGPLTLVEAVQTAQKNSPVLRGATSELDSAIAQVKAATAALKPSLSATTFLSTGSENGSIYNTPETVNPQNLFAVPHGPFADQNVMLMLPLLTGGRLQALRRAAQAAGQAAQFELAAMRLDVELETKSAYRTALLALESQKVAVARQQATAKSLENDRAAEQAGRVPQLYVLRDQAEDADAQQEVTNAARDVELAFLTLRAVMGVGGDSQFTLADALEPVTEADAANDIEADLATARRLRPELQGARQRLESARQGCLAARGALRFQASLVGMADLNRARGGSAGGASVGVVVGVPLFDGGLRRAGRDEASAVMAKAQADLDQLDIQIEREVRSAQITLASARQNVLTSQSALAATEEGYRVATLRYEAGRATNAEVLDSLAALTRGRTNQMRALYEAQAAFDQKERALGFSDFELRQTR